MWKHKRLQRRNNLLNEKSFRLFVLQFCQFKYLNLNISSIMFLHWTFFKFLVILESESIEHPVSNSIELIESNDNILSVVFSSPKIFGILRVFRLLRSLRPLRVINRAPGLKLVVQTLLSSLRPIGNIVLICCTFFLIFGILGVQLFKGEWGTDQSPFVLSPCFLQFHSLSLYHLQAPSSTALGLISPTSSPKPTVSTTTTPG